MAPRARLDDGLMDVVIVEPASRLQILRLFRRVYDGSHVDDKSVSYVQTERCSLQAGQMVSLNIDGEILETRTLEIEVVPRAIEVVAQP